MRNRFRNILLIGILLISILLVATASAQENTTAELTFGSGTLDVIKSNSNFIAAHGNLPDFLTSDEKKEWISNLDIIYTTANKNYEKEMSKYFYPNGPVIAYAYTIDGVIEVTIKNGEKMDTNKENEIYKLFSKYGGEIKVNNTPVVFVYGNFIVPTSRSSSWRPLIGGIKIVTDYGTSTLGFAAKTSSGTKGFVVNEHAAPTIGSSIYQPSASNANLVGSVSKYSKNYDSDASWVPCSNVNAKIYDHDTDVTKTVKSYGDPGVGQYVYKSGVSTGKTAGTITQKTSVYDSALGETLSNQYVVGYRCDYGDSGSPVYVDVTNGVKILGIHWGGRGTHTSTGFSSSVFSPVSGVHTDLGVYPLTA